MPEFLTLKPESFGLDISDLSLKIIKLKKKKRLFGKGLNLGLASFGEEAVPSGIVENGEIRDEEKLVKILKKALTKVKGAKLRTKYVVASLPEEKAFLEVIPMPEMKTEQLESAIRFEAENYIPLPLEKVYLDFQVVPDYSSKTLKVLVAALPKSIVNPYLFCFEKAGLIPTALEIESQAISRALIKKGDQGAIALMDVGAVKTGFAIFAKKSLRFTTSIPISSRQLSEAISKALNLNFEESEKQKIKYGIEKKEIFEALILILADLKKQVQKYLNYYQTHIASDGLPPEIEKIILSGGGANLKGLSSFLSQQSGILVEKGNPWINILPEPLTEVPQISYSQSLKYTTALGLALRGIQGKENFL